jgi:HEAT repeat protein
VPALIQALGDSDSAVRRAAAEALGAIGDPQAVPPLIQALRDRSENVRAAAAEALGAIGDPQAVPALIKALGDSDSENVRLRQRRRWANSATPKPCPRSSKHWGIGVMFAVRQRGRWAISATPKPFPRSSKRWGIATVMFARAAAEALGAIGDPQAMPALIQALGDSDSAVRAVAAEALGEDRRPPSRARAHPSTGG